jgi:hypothetical protein
MGRHQIIYTSCKRGIDGVNDGQQIFSYDRTFDGAKSDDVKNMFSYQVPALESGQSMTEELAKEMPQSFIYRQFENGQSALALNTYLGRDYMGSSGRFGNYLSHTIVCDSENFDMYPCEIYGSSSLRDHMEFEEVNNPDKPDYLPTPILEPGYIADLDSIDEFLGEGDNLEILKFMLASVIAYKSTKKRLVICDHPERTIKWIAAIEYCLPLEIAKTINFTTYEFDPSLSRSQICGVVPKGTRYNSDSYVQSGRYVVFDFINNKFSEQVPVNEPFIEFVDTAMSYSYDSLSDYFQFVTNHTDYCTLDENYYDCYLLYSFVSDGLDGISLDHFKKIIGFSKEHAVDSAKNGILTSLMDHSDTILKLDNDFALEVISYLIENRKFLKEDQIIVLRELIVQRVLYALNDPTITAESFDKIYNALVSMARTQSISISSELMNGSHKNELLGIISGRSVSGWKINAIIRIVCDYVKDMRLPVDELLPDHSIGRLIFDIFNATYASGKSNGEKLIDLLLSVFKDMPDYLTNMALNIDGYLRDINGGEKSIDFLWNHYLEYTADFDDEMTEETINMFAEINSYDKIYGIYNAKINRFSDFSSTRDFTIKFVNKVFSRYPAFTELFSGRVFNEYFNRLGAADGVSTEEGIDYCYELLDMSLKYNADGEYADKLLDIIGSQLPVGELNNRQADILSKAIKYQINVRQAPVRGMILLITIGYYLDNISGKKEFSPMTERIRKISGGKPAKLSGEESFITKYLDWILPNVNKYSLYAADYELIYTYFQMSSFAHSYFMNYFCKESYRKCKDGGDDYSDFSEYLRFMFKCGDRSDIESAGKQLCHLGKKKLHEIDKAMTDAFFQDSVESHMWKEVLTIAENTNPFLNSLNGLANGLFKKKS